MLLMKLKAATTSGSLSYISSGECPATQWVKPWHYVNINYHGIYLA